MNTNVIHTGDCFEVLATLPANSVHAVVSDPPYGLAFMGRDWDDFEPKEYQEWCEEWAEECKRVLKPGGHLLAFSGNRTHHRLFTGVEDAGFEIRDTLTWHYGSGFPKASDISKTIDKRADAEREVVGENKYHGRESTERDKYGEYSGEKRLDTEPATQAAKEWDGWKTGLKPATEFVVMARKPFDGATVDCVLEHGTGALNIAETRIDHNGDDLSGGGPESWDKMQEGYKRPHMSEDIDRLKEREDKKVEKAEQEGRYPSNVIFDEVAADALDSKNGTTVSQGGREEKASGYGSGNFGGSDEVVGDTPGYGDKGGPSRYFYTSKASKAERTENGSIDNSHPTVKPIDLMEWVIKLVTKENQIVVDPFTGSGTTCKAAKKLNRQFIGIEKQSQWADVARVRCGLTPTDPSVVRDDENQSGLEAYE